MKYLRQISKEIVTCSASTKLTVVIVLALLYHVTSKLLHFDIRLSQWIDGSKFDLFVDFFVPTNVEVIVVLPSIVLFFVAKFLLKIYQGRKNITLADVKLAMQNNELEVVLQPKKRLKDKSIKGAECLIRWKSKRHGLVMPDQFIPMVESDVATMGQLTEYVILHAAETYAKLKNKGFDIEIAVNVSATNMSDATIVESICRSLKQHHMQLERLVLEVTETAIMKHPELAIKVLVHLDSLGARISLDDFGTGHSSFLYLKNFPVREIKIDKQFISELVSNEHERAIVRSTIQLAHDIGARVVAEGVEDKATQTVLTELECDYVQGYYIAKPMSVEDMIVWLKINNEVHNDTTIKIPAYHA